MAERNWTKEQKQAINLKGTNILVSAAAGSGKTAVLVERIVNKIINEGIDIDKILVVTFTNAAASEMRQRLMDEIYKCIEKQPDNKNLRKQLLLINKANICTIHSFCLNVIRNNFFEIGISNNFRVADETEIEIMKQEIIADIFDEEYENEDQSFYDLLEKYTSYRDDKNLQDLIVKIYDFIQSNPFPEKWLNEAVEEYNIKVEDFSKTKWGIIILEKALEIKENIINNLTKIIKEISTYPNLSEFLEVLKNDLNYIENINIESWDNAYISINKKNGDIWPRKNKISEEEKEVKIRAKSIRDDCKTSIAEIQKMIKCSSEEAINDIRTMYDTLKKVQNLVCEFSKEYTKRKITKNIIDFYDIEHLALKILVDENGNPTEIAKKYNFDEIEIDEYQDSNSVQEYILTSVSNGKNVFMVGDVKQSIYKFRQANPKLFMKKYEQYILPKEILEENTKILLYKNFRSRKNILDLTNLVFTNIMSKKLGEIEYSNEEALNLGGVFEEPKIDCIAELEIIDTNKEENLGENDEIKEIVENSVLEARLVANKIKQLVKEGIKYKDITILLRSPKGIANVYEKTLSEQGIPVFSNITTEYLSTIEIDTIMSLLKIIDNPLQDIPLVTVLRSEIAGITDNELVKIRLLDKNIPFFRAVEKAKENSYLDDLLKNKIEQFLNLIEDLRKKQNQMNIDEFIWYIYNKTGYYDYVLLMPNGKLRQANLKKLFEKAKEYEKISFKGLFNFILFMEKVGATSKDLNSAKIIGENDDVVRIMSIHKSKGLEFPIVFLCNSNKRFNLRDISEKIVLDNEVGIGANYIVDGIEFPTLTKDAIRIKAKKEAISEEMRVLYVALTRAKDKLIITGTSNKVQKNLIKKEKEIEKYCKYEKKEKMPSALVEKYMSYLDWLELVYKYNEKSFMKLDIIDKNSLISDKESEEENKNKLNRKRSVIEKIENGEINKEKLENINKLLNYKYKYEKEIELLTKTSVTALNEEKIVNRKLPKFKENKKIKGSEKGTLMHLILSKITHERTLDEVKLLVDELKQKMIITNEEKEAIDYKIITNYLESELYRKLQRAKLVKKETPFYLNMDSDKIYEDTSEKILIQGIIDLYYIDENNRLFLVDYKTDYVKEENEQVLKEKYKAQLNLYRIALEKSLKMQVDKSYIYSTYLNKTIEI